jgi:DNA invertase Pin-like site-specific DNA recombinase
VARDYSKLPVVIENKDRVKALLAEGVKVEAIIRETGLTRYWIQRCMSIKEE